ncbi:MAG TPA: DUF6152 family protein [Caldimonas sp.]|jgi:hypothetical protein|nr:DUF6152 family protein [Caldimonas sp.]HEX2541995.1 DUF6152 family protein [Caldimonas sp.]
MLRRQCIALAAIGFLPVRALAHHGWSSFDLDKPIYLEGRVDKVAWRNPHAELMLQVAPDLRVPADLPSRKPPAQSAGVDGARIFAAAKPPTRRDKVWEIELAPLTRMDAWKVAEIKPGQSIAVIGYTQPGDQGEAVLRAEYLFADGKIYGLRSSPA